MMQNGHSWWKGGAKTSKGRPSQLIPQNSCGRPVAKDEDTSTQSRDKDYMDEFGFLVQPDETEQAQKKHFTVHVSWKLNL